MSAAEVVPGCGWFALCDEPAAGAVVHPALGHWVPCCARCAAKLGLDLVPAVWTVGPS